MKMSMYIRKILQIKFLDNFFRLLVGNKNNRCVHLADLIARDEFEEEYVQHYKLTTRGDKAKYAGVGTGVVFANQTKLKLVVEQTA